MKFRLPYFLPSIFLLYFCPSISDNSEEHKFKLWLAEATVNGYHQTPCTYHRSHLQPAGSYGPPMKTAFTYEEDRFVFWIILCINSIDDEGESSEEPKGCRSCILTVPWGTIAPPGCSSVSVMSLRIWAKFFLILGVCQQLLSGSCRSVCLTLNYSNTFIYIIAEINRNGDSIFSF